MRDTLNLQSLKHSKFEKHRKIYKKAHKIMAKGFETEELSKEQIMDIAKRYPKLQVSVIIGGDIVVRSVHDTWIIKDEGRFISLYHKAFVLEKGKRKEKYHIQDIFYDLDFAFASIVSHDEFKLGIKFRTTTDEIQEIVRESYLAVL